MAKEQNGSSKEALSDVKQLIILQQDRVIGLLFMLLDEKKADEDKAYLYDELRQAMRELEQLKGLGQVFAVKEKAMPEKNHFEQDLGDKDQGVSSEEEQV